MKIEKWLVVGCEHLRDGREEWFKLFDTQQQALECINKDRFAGDNHVYQLFKITEIEEVELRKEEIEEPQPPVIKKKWAAATSKKMKKGGKP